MTSLLPLGINIMPSNTPILFPTKFVKNLLLTMLMAFKLCAIFEIRFNMSATLATAETFEKKLYDNKLCNIKNQINSTSVTFITKTLRVPKSRM